MKIKELALSLPGRKFDFGCEKVPQEPFEGIDFRKRPGVLSANLVDPEDCVLKRLYGTASFISMRHVLCWVRREKAGIVLGHVKHCLLDNGFLLVSDFDLGLFVQRLKDSPTVEECLKAMGKNFSAWVRLANSEFKISTLRKADLLNFALRGFNEIVWRYDQKSFVDLLSGAGFSKIEYLPLNDPRSSLDFTHTKPEEDMVFLCQK